MRWELQWGSRDREFLEKLKAKGKAIPGLDSEPEIDHQNLHFWSAFCTLSSSRPQGEFGPSAIPLSDIASYLDIIAVEDRDERLEYLRLIKSLDAEYLEWAGKEISKKMDSKPKQGR